MLVGRTPTWLDMARGMRRVGCPAKIGAFVDGSANFLKTSAYPPERPWH